MQSEGYIPICSYRFIHFRNVRLCVYLFIPYDVRISFVCHPYAVRMSSVSLIFVYLINHHYHDYQ